MYIKHVDLGICLKQNLFFFFFLKQKSITHRSRGQSSFLTLPSDGITNLCHPAWHI